MRNEEVCGTCKYHECDGEDWICANDQSENYGDWTAYDDECDFYTERRSRFS